MTNRAPLLVAIVFLLLPLLYVGSYFALVLPGPAGVVTVPPHGWYLERHKYRAGGSVADVIFWPVEQVDKALRPDVWNDFERIGVDLSWANGPR